MENIKDLINNLSDEDKKELYSWFAEELDMIVMPYDEYSDWIDSVR